ncbi:hypothetical protein EDC04DRAFT_2581855 [Pisolithus marmoratus]|nr:hypothetical protein EDC04DRAFT_2581855 [Pisolithus marmoratus]
MRPLPFTSEGRSCRYDINLRKHTHNDKQRHMDPDTGQCAELVVQAVKPTSRGTNQFKQVRITDRTRRIPKLVVSLFRPKTCSTMDILLFILCWPVIYLMCSIHLLLWPIDGLPKGGIESGTNVAEYPPYLMYYWGHLWASRSQKEQSAFGKGREHHEEDLPPMAPGITSTPESTTHSYYPRRLVILCDDVWKVCDDHDKIASHRYFSVSYCQSDILESGGGEEEEKFISSIRSAALQCEMKAYWLDLECMGNSDEENHLDVYQLADIYRGAAFTLVALPTNAQSGQGWRSWSNRVWTLPEIMLSRELRYTIGPKGPVTIITLRELANSAYGHNSGEAAVVTTCGGTDRLYKLEYLTLLMAMIWRRGNSSQDSEKAPPKVQSRQSKGIDNLSYDAERAYALMAFFEHRIMPFPPESNLQALARLSMINDGYRIAERMLCMLPEKIPSKSCWYADDDQYKAQFWDIEPEVQVAGVTETGALVLDGCRAASIRWKDFPEVGVRTTKSGVRRLVAKVAVFSIPVIHAFALQMLNPPAGALALVFYGCATIFLILVPFMIAYSISGRILFTQPFLIGVKGAMKVEEASHYLYRAWLSRPRLVYTTSGSVLAQRCAGEGKKTYDDVKDMDNIYTLVDTSTGTLYYFTADRPPTVCLYTGREGGLGRFVLCSENCTANELHKETVLRMPSQIHRAMRSCGWLAIGGMEE